jgi:hypothetical protein
MEGNRWRVLSRGKYTQYYLLFICHARLDRNTVNCKRNSYFPRNLHRYRTVPYRTVPYRTVPYRTSHIPGICWVANLRQRGSDNDKSLTLSEIKSISQLVHQSGTKFVPRFQQKRLCNKSNGKMYNIIS